jgi:hypothetical protein
MDVGFEKGITYKTPISLIQLQNLQFTRKVFHQLYNRCSFVISIFKWLSYDKRIALAIILLIPAIICYNKHADDSLRNLAVVNNTDIEKVHKLFSYRNTKNSVGIFKKLSTILIKNQII